MGGRCSRESDMRTFVSLTAAMLVCGALPALGDTPPEMNEVTEPLLGPLPSWLDDALRQRAMQASLSGMAVDLAAGTDVPIPAGVVVQPGTLLLAHGACTTGFLLYKGGVTYATTAGHCVSYVGEPVLFVVGTLLLGGGYVSSFQQGGVGYDWAIVRLDPAVATRAVAALPVIGGPTCPPATPLAGAQMAYWGQGVADNAPLVEGAAKLATFVSSNTQSFTLDPAVDHFVVTSQGDSGSPVIRVETRISTLCNKPALGIITAKSTTSDRLYGTRLQAFANDYTLLLAAV